MADRHRNLEIDENGEQPVMRDIGSDETENLIVNTGEHLESHRENAQGLNVFIQSVDGKTITLRVLLEESVGKMKTDLQHKIEVPVDNMRLIYGGKVLMDEITLKEYNLQEHSTIFALFPVKGGTKTPMKNKKMDGDMEIEKTPLKNTQLKSPGNANMVAQMTEKLKDVRYDSFKENTVEFDKAKLLIRASEVYKIHTDGASKGNPGPASVGYFISDSNGKMIYSNALVIDEGTNNVAEYMGVILGLKSVVGLGIRKIHIYSDSELVVKQINGKYKVSNEVMKLYYEEVKSLLKELSEHEIHWIPRCENLKANQLAQDVLTNTNSSRCGTEVVQNVVNTNQDCKEMESKMQEENKTEVEEKMAPNKNARRQQSLDEFLKGPLKGTKPSHSRSDNRMVEKISTQPQILEDKCKTKLVVDKIKLNADQEVKEETGETEIANAICEGGTSVGEKKDSNNCISRGGYVNIPEAVTV